MAKSEEQKKWDAEVEKADKEAAKAAAKIKPEDLPKVVLKALEIVEKMGY
jgi:tRNA A37 N6-isopentenylltransferase MiaA